MKQLKFFTSQSETMQATKAALASLGISPAKMRVFARDNSQHRFDGLVLASSRKQEDASADEVAALYAGAGLIGAVAIYAQWIGFVEFFALVITFSALSLLRHFIKKPSSPKAEKEADVKNDCVYFFVVDVDERDEKRVSKLTQACPGLIAQS